MVTAITPKTFVSKTARTMVRSTELRTWSRASCGATCPEPVIPALLTRMSRRPAFLDVPCSRLSAGLVRDVEGQCVRIAAC